MRACVLSPATWSPARSLAVAISLLPRALVTRLSRRARALSLPRALSSRDVAVIYCHSRRALSPRAVAVCSHGERLRAFEFVVLCRAVAVLSQCILATFTSRMRTRSRHALVLRARSRRALSSPCARRASGKPGGV